MLVQQRPAGPGTGAGVALSKTYNTNQQTPDCAGTMTAMMSGIKTRAGLIGVNQHVNRADCASAMGNEVPSLMLHAARHLTSLNPRCRKWHALGW
ncbi:MAG TPA: hypothetical protein DD407_13180 [Pseudohongiella sp.]|nr:hypothetical protein [Pseudohongiella sp.]